MPAMPIESHPEALPRHTRTKPATVWPEKVTRTAHAPMQTPSNPPLVRISSGERCEGCGRLIEINGLCGCS